MTQVSLETENMCMIYRCLCFGFSLCLYSKSYFINNNMQSNKACLTNTNANNNFKVQLDAFPLSELPSNFTKPLQ